MYKLKQVPEDFFVKELSKAEFDEEGEYSYFTLVKRNYTTIGALQRIARKLKVPLKRFGFAGNKDKVAVTKQLCSVRGVSGERLGVLKIKDIKIEYVGNGKNPISLGDLRGNSFRIVARDLPRKRLTLKSIERLPNYFGEQRFSRHNVEIGRALVKRNFRRAVELVDDEDVRSYIETYPGDFIGALRKLPLKIRKIYVHAYQSWIWNKTAEEYVKKEKPIKSEKIPIVGFGTELKSGAVGRIIHKIMEAEGTTQRDFIIPQMKEVTAEGGERELFVKPVDFDIKLGKDELNEGKQKATLYFSLPKGSYATVVVKEIFSLL
jgi:tRNA pseudouridine13 synthase